MLNVILGESIFFLIIMGGCYWHQRSAVSLPIAAMTLGFFFIPMGGMTALIALLVAWVILAIVGSIIHPAERKSLAWLTGIAVSLSIVWFASYVPRVHEVIELRHDYPVESLRDRLAYEMKTNVDQKNVQNVADAKLESRLADVEAQLVQVLLHEYWRSRRGALEKLYQAHQQNVAQFVGGEGFGLDRHSIVRLDREYIEIPGPPLVPQPAENPEIESIPETALAPGFVSAPRPRVFPPARKSLETLHTNGIVDFASPERSGFAKDVDHVVGFLPHAFTTVPRLNPGNTMETRWKVNRLELVSLLKHDSPLVYDFDGLPNMNEIDNIKTRAVDTFESGALEKLSQGEDLVVSTLDNQIRMLGSLRAARQCVQCHNAKRGDLLGAFTYRIVRDMPGAIPLELQNSLPTF